MPKASKKKGERPDFAKPKLKLGKGKKPAANEVDTSFKARSIALPQQSITEAKGDEIPRTIRKLSLDDLVYHLKHYSVGVRKDALHGLRELLESNPALIEYRLLSLITNTVRLIGDEDRDVRKGLLVFYTWLLRKVPTTLLTPHAELLLLYTTSAQTHIFPEVRLDAVKFLDLLLTVIPDYVVSGCLQCVGQAGAESCTSGGHGQKVLDGYLSLLNVGISRNSANAIGLQTTPGPSVAMLSLVSKSSILTSLSTFLKHAIPDQLSSRHTNTITPPSDLALQFLQPEFSSPSSFASFMTLTRPVHSDASLNCRTVQIVNLDGSSGENFIEPFAFAEGRVSDGFGWSNERWQDLDLASVWDEIRTVGVSESQQNRGLGSNYGFKDSAYQTQLNALCTALQPVLVSTLLDCAPSVFSPSGYGSGGEEMALLLSVFEIARTVYVGLVRDSRSDTASKSIMSSLEGLRTLLTHMAPYFPFGSASLVTVQQDIKSTQTFQRMNIIYCELYSLVNLASVSETPPNTAPTSKSVNSNEYEAQSGSLPSWVSSISQAQAANRTGTRRGLPRKGQARKTATKSGRDVSSMKQTERVYSFVKQALHGQHRSSLKNSSGTNDMGLELDRDAYVSLLPTIWSILCQEVENNTELDGEESVLEVLLDHATRLGSTNNVKGAATEFVARLVLLDTERSYRGAFSFQAREGAGRTLRIGTVLRKWVEHLPKVLWELGDRQPAMSEMILLFLLRLLQRKHPLIDAEITPALKTRLVPFFAINHPTRGEVLGPYTKLAKFTSGSTEVKKLGLEFPNDRPTSQSQSHTISPLKRLALDVVSLLLAHDEESVVGQRRAREVRGAGNIAESGGGARTQQREISANSKPSDGSALSGSCDMNVGALDAYGVALVEAVHKALKGTPERGYWEGITNWNINAGANAVVGVACV